MAAFRAPVCFINLGLIPDRQSYCTLHYYLGGRRNEFKVSVGKGGVKGLSSRAEVRENVRGEHRFSSLMKQNKKAKICFVIYIAGFLF